MKATVKMKSLPVLLCLLAGASANAAQSYHYRDAPSPMFARFSPKQATFVIQAGGFNASQGQAQNVGIAGSIGDRFTLDNHHDNNGLFGLGYYVNGYTHDRVNVLLGLNAYYFTHTTVNGSVILEQLFTNLSYHYSINHYPIYAAAKIFVNHVQGNNDLTLDFGFGPNFIEASNFGERSLDGGITNPDSAFKSHTSTVFSVTAGIGYKFNHVLPVPFELGYRFFYLGQGSLSKNTDQILNTLKTGNLYANALTLTIYA